VQLTLVALAVLLAAMALSAWSQRAHPPAAAATLGPPSRNGLGEIVVLGAGAVAFAALAGAMGLRVVRGPDPNVPVS
jgi:hypothetical protein